MGGYENLAVRDAAGNIVGYRSTTGGSDFVPSANYIALQQQYQQQHNAVVGGLVTTYNQVSPPINYNDNSAAGIAAMITARGGTVDPYLSQKALQQGFITPQANIGSPTEGRSTVPIRDLSYEGTLGTFVPGATYATYPAGNEGGVTLIPGRTRLNTVTGESITENIPYGHSIYNIAGGGGAYSAQSGTTWAGSDLNKIPSAVVRTQDYGRYAPSDVRGVNTRLSVPDYATILANPKSYSRGGSEAYNFQAGVPLQAGRVLQTKETAIPSYGSTDWYSQRIAWGDRVATANTEGNPQKYPEVFAGSFATPTTQRLVEGVVTSEPGFGRRALAGSGMLVNYITPAGMQYKKGDDTSLSAQNVDMIDYGYKYTNPLSTPDRRSAAGGYVATPEPKEIWGRTTTLVPPTQESGNRFGDLQTTMGYVPNPKYVAPVTNLTGRKTVAGEGEITPVPLSPQTTVTKTMSGGNQTISNMGVWLTTSKAQLESEESSLDTTNAGAVSAYNLKVGEYMAKRDVFMAMQKENPVIETTTTTTTTTGETKPQSNGLPTGVYFTGEITPMKNINQEPSLIEKGQRVLGGIGGFFRSVGEVPYVGNVVDIVSNSPIASKLIPGFSLGADLTVKSPYTQATPEMPYGEYSQWSTSASDFFSRQLKNTPEAMLQQSEEAKQGAATAWTKGDIAGAVVKGFDTFRYGAASSVWQNPGQIPTAIVQGKVIGAGMEMYSGAVTPVITKVGNAGVVRQAAGWALQHAPEAGFVAMMAGESTRGEPIKTYGAAGNIVSEKQAPWFSTASGAQISQNVGKMAPAIVAMFGSGAVYDTIAGEKVTTTSSFIRTDPTMVASGGLFETGRIGIDPTQTASGGLLRSTPYKGEVISESTTSRVGGIFGEGGLYSRAVPWLNKIPPMDHSEGSMAIPFGAPISSPGGLYGSVGVPEIMTRFGGGYDSLGAPSGLTAKARALPEPMPIEYSGIGMSNFYGRPVKADMAITQSAEIPYRGAIAVPQPQYGYTTPMAEMGSISDTSSKSLVSTKTIYTPISEMGTIALISSRSDVAARSRSAATDLTNTYPGTSSKSESGVMAGIQTGSASKSSVESMSAISSGLVGSMSFSASSPISRSFDTVMPVSTPRSDVTAEDISFPYTSTISQVTTTPGTIPDTITTVAPPYQIVPPPIIPIIPILPSFPGVPSTPTGTPAKRRRAFTEFLPIGEGVGWINLLGTPTRQPAIMPSRKAAPAPTMRIAVPKSTSTVRIPKRGTPAKQKPLGGFSINIPKAKKGRVRRIS